VEKQQVTALIRAEPQKPTHHFLFCQQFREAENPRHEEEEVRTQMGASDLFEFPQNEYVSKMQKDRQSGVRVKAGGMERGQTPTPQTSDWQKERCNLKGP